MLLCLQPQKQEKMLNLWAYPLPLPSASKTGKMLNHWAYPLPLPSGNGLKDCPIILPLPEGNGKG